MDRADCPFDPATLGQAARGTMQSAASERTSPLVRCLLNMDPDKRKYRQLKRNVKQTGNKHRRRELKRELRDNPDEAHFQEENFGGNSSAAMNGNDRDATRKRDEEE
jgi:hypothetical protein